MIRTLTIKFVENKKLAISIDNAYEIKDELKKEGFIFNYITSEWEKHFDISDGHNMMMYVKANGSRFGIRNYNVNPDANEYLMKTLR